MVSEYWLTGLKEYLKVVKSFAAGKDCYLTGQNGAKIHFDTEQRRLDLIQTMVAQIIADVETEIAALSLSDQSPAVDVDSLISSVTTSNLLLEDETRVVFQFKKGRKREIRLNNFIGTLRRHYPDFEIWVEDPNAPPEVPPRWPS